MHGACSILPGYDRILPNYCPVHAWNARSMSVMPGFCSLCRTLLVNAGCCPLNSGCCPLMPGAYQFYRILLLLPGICSRVLRILLVVLQILPVNAGACSIDAGCCPFMSESYPIMPGCCSIMQDVAQLFPVDADSCPAVPVRTRILLVLAWWCGIMPTDAGPWRNMTGECRIMTG